MLLKLSKIFFFSKIKIKNAGRDRQGELVEILKQSNTKIKLVKNKNSGNDQVFPYFFF